MDHSKKVLILRSRSSDQAIRKIANTLNNEKYNVTLLIWKRNNDFIDDSNIKFSIKYFQFHSPQDRYSSIFFFPIWWIYSIIYILYKKPDIIHACDLDTEYPAIIGKILLRVKLVYSIYDYYANNLPEGKFNFFRFKIRKLVSFLENFGIGFSDLIILSDQSRLEEVKGSKIKSLIYIYNTPEDQLCKNITDHSFLASDFVIFYAGIISYIRGIADIIKIVNEITGVKLILAGPIIDKEILHGKLNPNIEYIGWISTYEELLDITSQSDILFRFSDPSHPKTKYESPNKLFEAMMCGKPIIVSDYSAMATIVRQEKCGLVIPYGDLKAIKNAILTLKCDSILRENLGMNGRRAYEKKYNWDIMEKRIISAYEEIYE